MKKITFKTAFLATGILTLGLTACKKEEIIPTGVKKNKTSAESEKSGVYYEGIVSHDGYSDQFGGERGKKFMSRNFKILLAENSHKPMTEQGQILDSTIENWKYANGSDFEQIDDITVLGIRIG